MNLFKEIFKNEVFPALGCTEPIAVAFAAGIASKEIGGRVEEIDIIVDPGVYKNGLAVTVPNTGGRKGNLIAGVLGALIRQPELKMEILNGIKEGMVSKAEALIRAKKARISYDDTKKHLYVQVVIKTETGSVKAVVEHTHTNLVRLEKNGRPVLDKGGQEDQSENQEYRRILKQMKISELIDLAEKIDDQDYAYIKLGIEMNLKISEAGQKLTKVGHYLFNLVKKGYLVDDVFSSTKILTASATDARMAGLSFPVMSSGGSGNQGIVAILVPYNVGKYFEFEEEKIIQSVALSHLVNSYIKCFTGDLSPLCGCSIAAGVGAAISIVYQHRGKDMSRITLAVNNLVSDLGGMLCDGAKGGCALKVVSSTDSAIRAAYMALNDYGITEVEGFVGKTAEETIQHLSMISERGMAMVDDTMLQIMKDKIL